MNEIYLMHGMDEISGTHIRFSTLISILMDSINLDLSLFRFSHEATKEMHDSNFKRYTSCKLLITNLFSLLYLTSLSSSLYFIRHTIHKIAKTRFINWVCKSCASWEAILKHAYSMNIHCIEMLIWIKDRLLRWWHILRTIL